MSERNKNICCVIVTYNGDSNLEVQIKELCNVTCVVIVDNGSSREFKIYIKRLLEKYDFHYIDNLHNIGLSAALNQGLEYANSLKAEYLLTLDQDSFFPKRNIDSMVKRIDDKVVSVGPFFNREKNNHEKKVNYLITSGNLVKVSVLNEIGGFDEKLFIDQIDIELSFRLLTHNYNLVKVSNTYIKHEIGFLEKSAFLRINHHAHSSERYYYMFRNERYILRKYGKKLTLLCIKSFLASSIIILKILFIENDKKNKIINVIKGWKNGKNL